MYVFLVRHLPARTCQFYTAESALKLRFLSSQLASSLGTQASMGWSDHKQKRILIKQSSHLQELLFVLRNLLGGLLGILRQAHVVQALALVLEGAQGGDLLRVAGLHVLQPLLVCIVLYEKRVNMDRNKVLLNIFKLFIILLNNVLQIQGHRYLPADEAPS